MKKIVIMSLVLVIALIGCDIASFGSNNPQDLIVAEEDGLAGYLDSDGNWAIKPQFESANQFSVEDGIALVRKQDRELIYIDTSGKELFSTKDVDTDSFSVVTYRGFSEGLAPMSDMNKVYYLNKKGEVELVIENIDRFNRDADTNYSFNDGLAKFGALDEDATWGETSYGFYDKEGNVVIDPIYRDVQNFGDGLAYVSDSSNDSNYYINTNGEKVIEIEDNASYGSTFKHEFARIGYSETQDEAPSFYFIDKNGDRAKLEDVIDAYGYVPIFRSIERITTEDQSTTTETVYTDIEGNIIPIIIDGKELDYINDINYLRSFGDRTIARFGYELNGERKTGYINIDGEVVWTN